MQKTKRLLASLLIMMMLISVLPMEALAVEATDDIEDIVVYNLGSQEIPVGSDEEKLDSGEIYELFEDDGSFTIWLEPDAFFPYEVQFTYEGVTTTEWFMTPEDSVEIGGHTFYVHSQQSDPTALSQLGVWVGDTYIPAYPEEKEFTNDGPQISLFSMMPLEEKRMELDLTGYLPDELKEVSLSAITSELGIEGDVAVWAKSYSSSTSSGDYTVIGEDSTIDLSDSGRTYTYLELIVGTADQLDLDNMRYVVDVDISYSDELFDVTVYSAEDERSEIVVSSTYLGQSSYYGNIYQIGADESQWSEEQEVYLSMEINNEFSGLDASVYEGYYETLEEIPEDAVDITDQIWNQQNMAEEGGYLVGCSDKSYYEDMPEITVVLKRDGNVVSVKPMTLYMYASGVNLSHSSLYADREGSNYRISVWDRSISSWSNGYSTRTYTMRSGYPANGEYYFSLEFYKHVNGEYTEVTDYAAKAVVGYYETADEIPEDAENIADLLFSDAYSGGGYTTDYSKGVVFTVVDIEGNIYWFGVKTVEGLPEAPTPLSSDTYFYVQGVDGFDSYVMPYNADSYYYNGYQTVLILDSEYEKGDDGRYGYAYYPVTDETIIPEFYVGTKVEAYAGGEDGTSGTKQISGQSEITFESGKAIQYSAAAEDGASLKNYWVTFLTQQSGPKLFVNATNNESHYAEVTDEEGNISKMPQREVFLTDDYGNHHDIFIANIGDEDITGLYVRLEDAQNVALDEYWTIGETTTLSAFTTTEKTSTYRYYGELANVAKIRLVPETDENGVELSGDITGTLIIGYTGADGEEGEEVRIKLTGVAGKPKITTESVLDGVKFVPYSSIIQTNNMYSSNKVRFEVTAGSLPSGVSIKANGELYGVPTKAGEYTFTVTAYSNGKSDSKEFTLTVLDNTDENVEAANTGEQGYKLLDAVQKELNVTEIDEEGVVFHSDGAYGEFIAFYLDGKALVDGEDYSSEEGSTKITIQAQTFKNAGNGTHTIAAEFRSGGEEDGTMKRTAQNVDVSGVVSYSSSGSSAIPTYSVSAGESSGGTVSVSKEKTSSGTTVTITVSPDEGYVLKEISAGSGIELTKISETEYTFVMPNSSVKITAIFEKAASQPDADSEIPFADVGTEDWFYSAVCYMYNEGLMLGTSETTFNPNEMLTRGMIVAVLYRLENEPEITGECIFSDVAEGSYYEKAIIWASENGIVDGNGDGTFTPDSALNREQMATILYRYAASKGYDVTARAELSEFSDSGAISDYALECISWANAEELIIGIGESKLVPDGEATRAQFATVLARFCEKIEK